MGGIVLLAILASQETPPIETSSAAVATSSAAGCGADYDCRRGELCRAGRCVASLGADCREDAECASGHVCRSGACSERTRSAPKRCKVDGECPGDDVCESGLCVTAVPPPPAPPKSGCVADAECPGAEVCEGGRCSAAVPPPPAPPAITTEAGPAKRPCKGLGAGECPRRQVCYYFQCVNEEETGRPPAERAPLRFGVRTGFDLPAAGVIGNVGTAYSIGAEIMVPVGSVVRFHFDVRYERLGAFQGIRADPLVIGFAIPISRSAFRFEIELVLAALETEMLFERGYAIGLSSGARLTLAAGYGPIFLAFTPGGISVRYFQAQREGVRAAPGINVPIGITAGIEL